jgi:hypothetical protein
VLISKCLYSTKLGIVKGYDGSPEVSMTLYSPTGGDPDPREMANKVDVAYVHRLLKAEVDKMTYITDPTARSDLRERAWSEEADASSSIYPATNSL